MASQNFLIKAAKTLALNDDLYVVLSEDKKDIAIIRGEADFLAFFDKYHLKTTQLQLFKEIGSEDLGLRRALEKCEWSRIQAIGCLKYAGVCSNLNKALDIYCLNQGYNELMDPFSIPIADLVAIYLRCQLSNNSLPKSLEKLYQKLPSNIINKVISHLHHFKQQLLNQYEFGLLTLKLLKDLEISREKPDPTSLEKTITEVVEEESEKIAGEKPESSENVEVERTQESLPQDLTPKKIEADSSKTQLVSGQYSPPPLLL